METLTIQECAERLAWADAILPTRIHAFAAAMSAAAAARGIKTWERGTKYAPELGGTVETILPVSFDEETLDTISLDFSWAPFQR